VAGGYCSRPSSVRDPGWSNETSVTWERYRTVAEAREKAYANVKRIRFQDLQYRSDIAGDA